MESDDRPGTGRRRAVLESAMRTFAEAGYRTTSMDAVARAARISRPGLYFLFSTKEALFREAAAHVLSEDLIAIDTILRDPEQSLEDRLVAAFDRWAGRYLGPAGQDIPAVVADNPDLLDATARAAPEAFERLLTTALEAADLPRAAELSDTLVSLSIGLKHRASTREEYLLRLGAGIALLTGRSGARSSP